MMLFALCAYASQSQTNEVASENATGNGTNVSESGDLLKNPIVKATPIISDQTNKDCSIVIKTNSNLRKKMTWPPEEEREEGIMSYEIVVANEGQIAIRDVRLNDTLPSNTVYKDSKYKYPNIDGILNYPTRIENNNGTTKLLSWFLGDLQSRQNKTIILTISYDESLQQDISKNKINVTGSALGILIDAMPYSN
jgi:hypothetical protein